MPIAYSFKRFSHPSQARGDSLRRQLARAEQFVSDNPHLDLVLDTSLTVRGVSAFRGQHRIKGALADFLAKVDAGEIERGSYFLLENMDRLSREKVMEAFELFSSLIRAGITVVTLMDGRSYSEDSINANWTELIITLGAMSRAHEESSVKADRLAENWTSKAARLSAGSRQKWTSVVPFWLRLEGKDRHERLSAPWTILDGTQGTPNCVGLVLRIFDLALTMGADAITGLLNKEAIAAPKRRDGWHSSTIKLLLKDRRVLGEFQRFSKAGNQPRHAVGEPIPGYFPPIIERELFYSVQNAIASRRCGGGGQKGKRPNLFSGLTRCECGRAMEYRDKGHSKGRFLVCSGNHRKRGCQNSTKFIYAPLEAAVLDFVADVEISDVHAHSATLAGLKLNGKVAERADVQARINRVRRDLETEDDFDEIRALKGRRTVLKNELVTLNNDIALLTSQANTGKRTTFDDRRAALKRMREQLATLEGDSLFAARSRLAAGLLQVIDFATFDSDGDVYFILAGGLKAYRFRDGCFLGAMDHTSEPPIEGRAVRAWRARSVPLPMLIDA